MHTFPTTKESVYTPLLQAGLLEGASLQVQDANDCHAETLEWVGKSAAAGKPWCVCVDEIGPPSDGVVPDANDPTHDVVRREALWGNLMAGGAGGESYFGYAFPNDDLNCEDFRSRDAMWALSRIAGDFCTQELPLDEMAPADALATAAGAGGAQPAWCLAQPGIAYALYLPQGGTASLDLGSSTATFAVTWYDPRLGGALQQGAITSVAGPGVASLGSPPYAANQDWALLVRTASSSAPVISAATMSPDPFPGGTSLTVNVTVSDAGGAADVQSVSVYSSRRHCNSRPPPPAQSMGSGHYVLTVPWVPKLPSGTWIYVPLAIGTSGTFGYAVKSFGTP